MSNARTQSPPDEYDRCLIKPMTEQDGEPLIEPVHLVDATIVAGVVFFSLLLGDAIPALLVSEGAYITAQDILRRLPTAAIAFGLVTLAQWARYRGVQLRSAFGLDSGGDSED